MVRLKRSHYLIAVDDKAFVAIRTEDRRWVLSEVTYGTGLLIGVFSSLRAARREATDGSVPVDRGPGTLGGVAA